MNAETLLALADRCEKAEGPDRGIDLEIMRYAMNIGGPPETAKPYTASLDAAMTLVPVGCGLLINEPGSYAGKPWVNLNLPNLGPLPPAIRGEAVTPALALCAAALRALASDRREMAEKALLGGRG